MYNLCNWLTIALYFIQQLTSHHCALNKLFHDNVNRGNKQ